MTPPHRDCLPTSFRVSSTKQRRCPRKRPAACSSVGRLVLAIAFARAEQTSWMSISSFDKNSQAEKAESLRNDEYSLPAMREIRMRLADATSDLPSLPRTLVVVSLSSVSDKRRDQRWTL